MDGVTYTYDTDGIRLTKTVGNVTITYTTVGGKLLAEEASDASTITQYFYDASGNPVAMCRDNVCYFYSTNLQGDIIALYAEGGAKICDYYYNADGSAPFPTAAAPRRHSAPPPPLTPSATAAIITTPRQGSTTLGAARDFFGESA